MKEEVGIPYLFSVNDLDKVSSFLKDHLSGFPTEDQIKKLGKNRGIQGAVSGCVYLNILKRNGRKYYPTPEGKKVILANPTGQYMILAKIFLTNKYYESILQQSKNHNWSEITVEKVKEIWSDLGINVKTILNAGPVTFLSLCEKAELGRFIKGGGKGNTSTRLEINKENLSKLFASDSDSETEDKEQAMPNEESYRGKSSIEKVSEKSEVFTSQLFDTQSPSVTVTVDMTQWDLEKIREFYRIHRGEK